MKLTTTLETSFKKLEVTTEVDTEDMKWAVLLDNSHFYVYTNDEHLYFYKYHYEQGIFTPIRDGWKDLTGQKSITFERNIKVLVGYKNTLDICETYENFCDEDDEWTVTTYHLNL